MRTIFEFSAENAEIADWVAVRGDSNPRAPLGFDGRNFARVWRPIRPEKSIRAGENLFARDSALLWISPVPFVRQDDARNLVTSAHQTMVWSSNLPLLGGQSAIQLRLFGIAQGGVRSGVGAGAVCAVVSNA